MLRNYVLKNDANERNGGNMHNGLLLTPFSSERRKENVWWYGDPVAAVLCLWRLMCIRMLKLVKAMQEKCAYRVRARLRIPLANFRFIGWYSINLFSWEEVPDLSANCQKHSPANQVASHEYKCPFSNHLVKFKFASPLYPPIIRDVRSGPTRVVAYRTRRRYRTRGWQCGASMLCVIQKNMKKWKRETWITKLLQRIRQIPYCALKTIIKYTFSY